MLLRSILDNSDDIQKNTEAPGKASYYDHTD